MMKEVMLDVISHQKIDAKDVKKGNSPVTYFHLFFFLPHNMRC